jgi:hypothetical protein
MAERLPQQSVRVGLKGRLLRIFERKTKNDKVIYIHTFNVPESGIVRVNATEKFGELEKDIAIWANVSNDTWERATAPQFWFAGLAQAAPAR